MIDKFRRWSFGAEGIEHAVYSRGKGAPVVLMHELPGMTPGCIRTGEQIVRAGFTVHMPMFFGEPGRTQTLRNLVTTVCVRREFNTLTSNGASPIANWLRALCREVSRKNAGSGVGLIGMCFTGNVVLSVMLEPVVRVPVLCEPALPFFHRTALGIPDSDVDTGLRRSPDSPILAFRFSEDKKCPRERFETLRSTYGTGIKTHEYSSAPGNPFRIPQNAHSVLTNAYPGRDHPDHPSERALSEILTHFRTHLVEPVS